MGHTNSLQWHNASNGEGVWPACFLNAKQVTRISPYHFGVKGEKMDSPLNILTRPPINSPRQLVLSSTCSLIYLFSHQLVLPSTRSPINSSSHLLILSSTHPLVNSFPCQLLFSFSRQLDFVFFSAIILTLWVPSLSTKRPPDRKKSILAKVGSDTKRG